MQTWRFRRKIHTSWLIGIMSGAIVVGVAAAPHISQTFFASFVWVVAGCTLMAIVLWRRSIYLLPLVIIAGLLIGLWRSSVLASQLVVYKEIYNHQVQINGRVADDPETDTKASTTLRLNNISLSGHEVAGKIWISTHGKNDIKRGDIVSVSGVASEGFGSFVATMYEAKIEKVMRPEPGDVAGRVRDWFAEKIRIGITEPEASLGIGYLLGQKRALPDELSQALVITGLTHAVVASGYNLTILVRLARRLFVRVSKYLATLSASVLILSFIAITGLSPSMSRAGLVSGLSLAAWYYGRKFHPLVLLPFAAAITVLIDPTYAWNDLGWQLSFTAFGGVMILAPLLQRYFFGKKEPGTARQILGETLSAHIVTLPILVFAFGQFSNVAIITNMLVLPLIPLAMLLVFVTGMSAAILPVIAPFVGIPAQWLLTYMVSVINYFAELSWAQGALTLQPWMVWAAYGLIVAVCVYLWRATKLNLRETSVVE